MGWLKILITEGGKVFMNHFAKESSVKSIATVISNPVVAKLYEESYGVVAKLIPELDELEDFLKGVKEADEPLDILMGRVDAVFGKDKFNERTVLAILHATNANAAKKDIVIAAITDIAESKVEEKVKGNWIDLVFVLIYEVVKRIA